MVQKAGEDELRAWRAGCLERGLSGSERGGWKRAVFKNGTSLAAYAIPLSYLSSRTIATFTFSYHF